MPYIKDGDFNLTESKAIGKYLCLKANRLDLLGSSEQDRIKLDMLYGVIFDLRESFKIFCFKSNNSVEH